MITCSFFQTELKLLGLAVFMQLYTLEITMNIFTTMLIVCMYQIITFSFTLLAERLVWFNIFYNLLFM